MIPEAAVEAAAKVMQASDIREGVGEYPIWDYVDEARAALEAAAPHMFPRVWDEGHEEGWLNHESGLTESQGRKRNPYRPTQ